MNRRDFIASAVGAGAVLAGTAATTYAGKTGRRDDGPVALSGATILDGNGGKPIESGVIVIEGRRIRAVGPASTPVPPHARKISLSGKYVIPGLMNANVHLMSDLRLESLARYMGRYEDLIVEAAQIALRSGLTTVFDTAGPRRFLMAVRDRINAGEVVGSRIFCAGWIVGFDGPFSAEFLGKSGDVASAALNKRISALWVENIGRHLMWLSPEQVAREVRAYIGKGIDFVKYASNEHWPTSAGAFLEFTPRTQEAIVEEVHRAGLTAQAHTMSVEGLRIAVEAGCELIQHPNFTGPVPIPESTLELMVRRKTGAAVFPWTEKGFQWVLENSPEMMRTALQASDVNARNFVRSGVPLLLANDGYIVASDAAADPAFSRTWAGAPEEQSLPRLGTGHFVWLKAMEEKGMAAMEILKAATRNIAVAYGKDNDLGTLEPGKAADLLVLDKDPLQAADNYRSIHMIFKDGAVVDRKALPENSILTKPMEPPVEEEKSYVPFSRKPAQG